MDPRLEAQLLLTRRHFFGLGSTGIGVAALAGLLRRDLDAAGEALQGLGPENGEVGPLELHDRLAAHYRRVSDQHSGDHEGSLVGA